MPWRIAYGLARKLSVPIRGIFEWRDKERKARRIPARSVRPAGRSRRGEDRQHERSGSRAARSEIPSGSRRTSAYLRDSNRAAPGVAPSARWPGGKDANPCAVAQSSGGLDTPASARISPRMITGYLRTRRRPQPTLGQLSDLPLLLESRPVRVDVTGHQCFHSPASLTREGKQDRALRVLPSVRGKKR